jgi:hypothetical protein
MFLKRKWSLIAFSRIFLVSLSFFHSGFFPSLSFSALLLLSAMTFRFPFFLLRA